MRTKWQILEARKATLQAELDQITFGLEGLAKMRCNLNCAGCGEFFPTEADFAKHFLIPDEQYLNLGKCPNNLDGPPVR